MLPDIQTHGVLLKYLPILEVTHTHTHTQAGGTIYVILLQQIIYFTRGFAFVDLFADVFITYGTITQHINDNISIIEEMCYSITLCVIITG